ADLNLLGLAVDQDAQPDVPFELVEELLALVDVEVRARVGSADHGDHELPVRPDLRIAHGRLEQVTVLLDPTLEVERRESGHGRSGRGEGEAQRAFWDRAAIHLSSMAIGVGSEVISTVVRQGGVGTCSKY